MLNPSTNCRVLNAHSRCRMKGCVCECHGDGCPITMNPSELNEHRDVKQKPYRCNQPLAEGAKFCEKHEADRIRLS